jgi:hypothetical protein
LVGVVALLAGASVALGDRSLSRTGGEPAVSLPDADQVGEDRSLDPEEREAALAPFDPERIGCAPAGCEVWRRSLPAEDAHLVWAHATGTSVLVAHEAVPVGRNHQDEGNGSEVSPDVSVTVLDTLDGQLRWSKGGFRHLIPLPTLAGQEGLVLVGADEAVLALELATGEPRYELPGGPDLWPHHHAGGLLGIDDLGAGTSSLVSASDGSVWAELPGAARSMLEFDGLVIALLESGGAEPGAPSREVVAVDPDGSIAWRHPLERAADDRCCPSMLDLEGRWVRVSDGPGAGVLVVDAGDGSVRLDDPLGATQGEEVADEWQVGHRLLMQHPAMEDTSGYVLRDSSGRSLQISGRGWPDPSNAGTSDTVLLTNVWELVAVRFP